MTAVLGIFAKWPAPGQAKTRLGLPPEEAARAARAFLLDTIARMTGVAERAVVVYSPPGAGDDFRSLLGPGVELEPQADGDLGARLEQFLAGRLRAGAMKVVVVGSDSPTLPIDLVAEAFARLDAADVVLGPATDGGYYLFGCRRLPPCFVGIPWSGPGVLAETVARLTDPAWRLALLPPWYDVDTAEGWAMLRGHLLALRRAGIDPGAPATEALVGELAKGYSLHASSRTSSAT